MKKEGGNYGKRAPRFFLMIAGFVFLFFLTRPMFGSPIILFEATFSDGGTPIQGARTVTISLNSETDLLVNDPGQKIWEETFSSVFFKDGGYLALELGRKTPLKSDYFKGSKLHFVVAVEGILGLVSVPLRSVPYAMFSELAESAVQVDTAVITGNIPVSQLRGVYPGITGLGTLTTTLNVATDFAVDFNTLFVDSRSHRVGIGTRTPISAN